MPKRLKAAKEWGIRPHVFHIWADEVIVAIEMQQERLLAHRVPANYRELSETEQVEVTEVFFRRVRIDLDFYFGAARRLLRAAEAANAEGYGGRPLRDAVKAFKLALPGLVAVRDAAKHPDDQLRMGLTRSFGMGTDGADLTFHHGNDRFSMRETSVASRTLYEAIKTHVPAGAPAEIVPRLRRGEAARAVAEATWFPGSEN